MSFRTFISTCRLLCTSRACRQVFPYAFGEEYRRSWVFRDKEYRGRRENFLSYVYTMASPAERNLGDNIQTMATEYALRKIFSPELSFSKIPRDGLSKYSGPESTCVMQGWYECGNSLGFLPSKNVVPVWVGTHFCGFVRKRLKALLKLRPKMFSGTEIGCRDLSTLRFCKENGIEAYFSRCLTLTLPRRESEPKAMKVFCVNTPSWVSDFLPKSIKTHSEFINQRTVRCGYEESDLPKYEQEARALLKRYKSEATLVITSALHCAQPCLASGIPVVFVEPERNEGDCERFSSFRGLIPVYTREDFEKGRVDFSPKCPDFEGLKKDMLENLRLSVLKEWGGGIRCGALPHTKKYRGIQGVMTGKRF